MFLPSVSVCALPDGLALIWELGRGTLLLLRVRTQNKGHRVTDMGILKGGAAEIHKTQYWMLQYFWTWGQSGGWKQDMSKKGQTNFRIIIYDVTHLNFRPQMLNCCYSPRTGQGIRDFLTPRIRDSSSSSCSVTKKSKANTLSNG